MFEVNRKPDHLDEYLDQAKHLKPILETIDGFIDNERFESKLRAGWLLSHSTWRDEKSVVRWRTEREHHGVQEKGRFEIFLDYHLRVGEVVSDTAPPANAPLHEQRFDETEISAAKYSSLTEITPHDGATFGAQAGQLPAHLGLSIGRAGLLGHEVYASINTPGKLALQLAWQDADIAKAWTPKTFECVKEIRHRVVRVVRDYGMYDRAKPHNSTKISNRHNRGLAERRQSSAPLRDRCDAASRGRPGRAFALRCGQMEEAGIRTDARDAGAVLVELVRAVAFWTDEFGAWGRSYGHHHISLQEVQP